MHQISLFWNGPAWTSKPDEVVWFDMSQRNCSCRVGRVRSGLFVENLPSLVVSVIWISRNSSTLPKVFGGKRNDQKVMQRRRPTGKKGRSNWGVINPYSSFDIINYLVWWKKALWIQLMNLQITNFMKVPKWYFWCFRPMSAILVNHHHSINRGLCQIYLKLIIFLLFVPTSPATMRLVYFWLCRQRGFDLLPFGRRVSYSLDSGDWTSRKWFGWWPWRRRPAIIAGYLFPFGKKVHTKWHHMDPNTVNVTFLMGDPSKPSFETWLSSVLYTTYYKIHPR